MTDLGVAHIVIARKTDGGAVRLERDHGILRHNGIKRGGVRGDDRVGGGGGSDADAVHNDGDERALYACELLGFFECIDHVFVLLFYEIFIF